MRRILLYLLVVTAPFVSLGAAPTDWPAWRGPQRDAISTETGLLQSWEKQTPPLLWQIGGLGDGFSSVAIARGMILTMGERPINEGDEKKCFLFARKVDEGQELWASPVGSGKPNCTPTVDKDLVFALGREGDLLCARTSTGGEVWRRNLGADFGGKMMSGWGYSESPFVDGDRLVCTPGAKDAMIVALERKTGEVIWKAGVPDELGEKGTDGAGYSSIVAGEGGGIRQYVQLTGRGVLSFAAEDGRFLWAYNRVANGTANIPTPIVTGDYVFCSTGYGTGAALLKLSPHEGGVSAEEVYFLTGKEMQNHHGGMVRLGDYIYCGHGNNQGFPLCIEMKTGKVAWRPGRGPGKGSAAVLYADGHLYFRYQSGIVALIEATPEEYRLKGTFEIDTELGKGESWPHPVIVDGRLYLRAEDVLLCYGLRP